MVAISINPYAGKGYMPSQAMVALLAQLAVIGTVAAIQVVAMAVAALKVYLSLVPAETSAVVRAPASMDSWSRFR